MIIDRKDLTLNDLKKWYNRLMRDLMADDFTEAMDKLRYEVSHLLEKNPELDTKENREYFGMIKT